MFEVKASEFRTPSKGWCGNRPQCVAVAIKPMGVAVRDTKDNTEKTLYFSKEEWTAFLGAAKSGEFDV